MPWLIGTALLHSLAATEKRGVFKAWTSLLAIAAFSFSLLGTFLVRSGVLTSVHSFATDPVRGLFILIFLGIVVGFSLALFAYRASTVSVTSWFGWLSREVLFLLNNLILAVVTLMILMGTLQPIFAELFGLGRVSVGPPYFNLVFTILMTPLIFLMGLGPIVNWRQFSMDELIERSKAGIVVAILFGLSQIYFQDDKSFIEQFQIFLGMFLVAWVVIQTLSDWYKRSNRKTGFKPFNISASHYAMYTAHIGLVVVVIGVVLASHLSFEKIVRLGIGDEQKVEDYTFRFDKIENFKAANYDGIRGIFTVYQEGKLVATLTPEKRQYHASGQWMTEAGIDATITRDLYIAMGEKLPNSEDWAVRVYVKAYVTTLWLGGILMGLGGLIAISDKRYRKRRKKLSTEQLVDLEVIA